MNISKIITNSHRLPSETRHWSIPKMPWDEMVFHLFSPKSVEHEKYSFLDCSYNTHI